MGEQKTSDLGKALTALGLEDAFLSNGELGNFPLMERGQITQGIIAEKLRLGKWQSVIRMMYGGEGNASALYEGDRDALKEEIVRSASEHPLRTVGFREDTIKALVKSGENDLLFRLATSVHLSYEKFTAAANSVDQSYYEDGEQGAERRQRFHNAAGNIAMRENILGAAHYHFSENGDTTHMNELFEAALDHSGMSLLEEIALSEPSKKDERLRRIIKHSIDSSLPFRSNVLAAFELAHKYGVELTAEEKTQLQEELAKRLGRHEVEEKLANHPEERLLWAQAHAEKEPRAAYQIFSQQGHEGIGVVTAVLAGLNLDIYSHENKEKALDPKDISEKHLQQAYLAAPFKVKVKIASRLGEPGKLQELSREAHRNDDLKTAYRLWVAGGGDLNDGYIVGIKAALIKDGIKNHFGYMDLDRSDTNGLIMAYDALMGTEEGERSNNLSRAYGIARDLGDEARTQRAREAMMGFDPRWALLNFASSRGEGKDEEGLDFAIGVVASAHGVEQSALRGFFDKYHRA